MKILYYIKKYIYWIRQFDEKEQQVLIQKMPSWYVSYQYGLFSRICRFFAMCFVALIFQHVWILELLNNYYNLNFILTYIDKNSILIIYNILNGISVIFLFLHCVFHSIIRILFFPTIVKNSPVSMKQCFVTGFRICRYGAGALAVTLGVPGIDYCFEQNGHVAALKGTYINRHIQFFGANTTNCAVSTGDTFTKEGIFNSTLLKGQEYTLYKEKIANNAFNNAQNQGMDKEETTRFVLEALRNN
uniref:hypothetical protein n=1 Tax=Thecamoeba quadrilineata TaxID=343530 RepID=UPI00226C9068|nr:hypothetical protein OYV93_mgp21 [Thecamoeba quadrilineata]UZN43841.1 hypothetical protein [Thecamoeba quadrilineata]